MQYHVDSNGCWNWAGDTTKPRVTRRENMRRQRGFLTYDNDRDVAERVLSLRGHGLTFSQVSAATGVSRSRCHRLATGQWQRTEEVI